MPQTIRMAAPVSKSVSTVTELSLYFAIMPMNTRLREVGHGDTQMH